MSVITIERKILEKNDEVAEPKPRCVFALWNFCHQHRQFARFGQNESP